jgi:hypothetical protein
MHLCVVASKGIATLYVDGELGGTLQTVQTMVPDPDSPTWIGRSDIDRDERGNTVDFFKGALDAVRVYDRALSVDEVLALYDEGAAESTPSAARVASAATATTPAAPQSSGPRFGQVQAATGNLSIGVVSAATVTLLGQSAEVPNGGTLPVQGVPMGPVTVRAAYPDGKVDEREIQVAKDVTTTVSFEYRIGRVPGYIFRLSTGRLDEVAPYGLRALGVTEGTDGTRKYLSFSGSGNNAGIKGPFPDMPSVDDRRKALEARLAQLTRSRRALRTAGWVSLGVGVAGAVTGAVSYLLGFKGLTYAGFATGGGGVGLGLVLVLAAPSTKALEQDLNEVKRELVFLSAPQMKYWQK